MALNVAVTRKRLIPYNPAIGADRPVVKRRQPTMLDDAQVARLLAVLEDDRLGPLFRLLATTGIRRGEALALRWSDFDKAAGTLAISKTLLYRAGEGFELVAPKTRTSNRVIRLSLAAQAALKAQAKAQAAERLRHGNRWRDHDLIFTAQQAHLIDGVKVYGEPLSGATVVHAMHRLCDEAKVPRLRPHDLRHMAATWITEAVGIGSAQAVLGHSTVTMTGRYAHPSATSQAAADAIDARLLPTEREEEAK
ncbi:MAG TPA: site-specific integrase [Mycobacteriales bacterium]|nr:site-specific integrase [Mycobacteriales bacterium]